MHPLVRSGGGGARRRRVTEGAYRRYRRLSIWLKRITSRRSCPLAAGRASDRHVVKPWLNGKIDFAPPVVDLADQGFPLAGGRLDYLDGRVIPALVYRRRLHVINLFIRPARPAFASPGSRTARNGYSLSRWATGGLEYWAVSDLPPAELDQFSALFRERTADQTEP